MLRRMRRLALSWVMTAFLACSSNGPAGGDGSAVGGSSGNGDAGGDGPADPCVVPLSQNTVCGPSFDMQVADNPCDPATATQAMCGRYKVWTSVFVGSDFCVYDTSDNGKLVGARSCGSVTTDPRCGNCITYGISASLYATCGTDMTACPP
jgi:hypothetical protein